MCEDNGTFTVDWTVGNSETPSTHFMLIRAYSVTPNVGTTTGLTADATYDGIVGPEYPGTGTVVDPGGDVPAVTSGIPGNTTSVTLTVTGFWKYVDRRRRCLDRRGHPLVHGQSQRPVHAVDGLDDDQQGRHR